MSRSRRKFILKKCLCGLHLIPFLEKKLRNRFGCPNPMIDDVHKVNNRYLKYRRERDLSTVSAFVLE